MSYRIIRSKRKTIGLEITDEGLLVRAPLRASRREIESVISAHETWIRKKSLAEQAREYIPQRVFYYAPLLGVSPGRITIRNQKTRWGSCSAKGNLNFNCLLMLTPPEVIDSVVVHELCHLLEMNHSKRFYDHVLSVYPDYRKHHAWLTKHGPEIMARAFISAK